ncbi:hypothetical protein ACWDRB_63435 [Nonomuraea sp. NPDC003707]
MKKRNKLYAAAGVAVGIAFSALAVSDACGGNSGNALHELLNAVMSWTASGVLAYLDQNGNDHADDDR